MSRKTKQIDKKVNEISKTFQDYLVFILRDEIGANVSKVRVTVFTQDKKTGTHMTEVEQFIDVEKWEESYQQWASRDVLAQAKEIIDSEKRKCQ